MSNPINVHASESLHMGYGASSEMMQQAKMYDQINNKKQDILDNDQMGILEKEKKIKPLEEELEDVSDKMGEIDEKKDALQKKNYIENKAEELKSAFDEQTAKSMIKMEMLMNTQLETAVEPSSAEGNLDTVKAMAQVEEQVVAELGGQE